MNGRIVFQLGLCLFLAAMVAGEVAALGANSAQASDPAQGKSSAAQQAVPAQERKSAHPADRQDTLSTARIESLGKSNLRSSAPLSMASRALMDTLGQTSLVRVINDFAGVSIKDYGGVGGIKTIDVRNLGAAHTAVEYDGVAMGNFQNASVDIGRFDLGELANVSLEIAGSDEIFRSATRQLAAGILSLESACPRFEGRPFHLSAQLSGGSFYYGNARIGYEQLWGKDWSTRIGGAFLYAKGDYPYLVKNGVASTVERRLGSQVLDGRGNFDLYGRLGNDGGRLHLKLLYSQDSRGIPGPVIFYSQDPTEHLWDKDLTVMAAWENEFDGGWRVRANLSYGWSFTRYRNESALYRQPEVDNYDHHKLALGAVAAWRFHPKWQLSLAEDLTLSKLDSDIPECLFPRRLHSATALSAKFENSRWLVRGTLGLLAVSDKTLKAVKAPDRFHCSPSLSASFAILEKLRLRLSYKDSYRIPSFNDLYYARVGNPDLLPERASQFNLGLTGQIDGPFRLEAAADGYCNLIRDKIIAVPKMFIWSMRNVGKALAAGTDLSLKCSYAFTPAVSLALQAKYSWQYAVDRSDPESQTWMNQLPYTPRHTGGGTFSVFTRWINLSYTLDAVSERYTLGLPLRDYCLDGYLLHAISLNHTFDFKGWKLYLAFRAENLGDTQYEIVKSYPMPGFHCLGTLRIII